LGERQSLALHHWSENVPTTPHRFDQFRRLGVAFNLASQSANLDVDAAIKDSRFSPASKVHQLISAQDPLRPFRKDNEEVELAGG
jgi:hypothetical protein